MRDSSMSSCRFYREYTDEQGQRLIDAVNEEKWYMSEREGRDVGFETAMQRFIDRHLDHFANDFRIQFCHQKCPMRTGCELSRNVHRIASIQDAVPSRI